MRAVVMPLIMLARVSWLVQLVIGSLFWTGHLTGLVPLHIIVGLIFVFTLWALAALALMSKTGGTMAWVALAWGLLTLLLGLGQVRILVGDPHPIAQIVHLLVGIAALGFAEDLARRMRRPQAVAY
jgi:hypothetical protein